MTIDRSLRGMRWCVTLTVVCLLATGAIPALAAFGTFLGRP
jgi:hypothetical protein